MKPHASNPRDVRERRAKHATLDRLERRAGKSDAAADRAGIVAGWADVAASAIRAQQDRSDASTPGSQGESFERPEPSPDSLVGQPADGARHESQDTPRGYITEFPIGGRP